MKQLERVLLVQFFLFEKQEFELGKFVGIFGANGSGKSSLMDAIQIAMHGADSNRIRFNAQAGEGKTSDRTINTYCLGRLGEDEYARDEALTYITLVWRDEQTGEATSTGVCVRASRERDKHDVLGRYVLPGKALTLADHITLVNGDEMPTPYADFRDRLTTEAVRLGHQEVLFDSATRYVQAMLYALRPASAVIHPDAFQKALSLGLNMRFDKSVDRIVREDMLVAKPTKIEKFRELVHTMGKLRQLIKSIETKIEDGKGVEQSFAALDKVEQQRAAYGTLLADIDEQIADEALQAAEVAETTLRGELVANQAELKGTIEARNEADLNWQTATARLNADVSRQQRIVLQGKLEQQNAHTVKTHNAFVSGLNAIQTRLESLRTQFGNDIGDQIDQADLAMNPLLAHPLDTPAEGLTCAVETAQQVLAQGYRLATERNVQLANRLHEIEAEQAAVERGLERVRTGKRPLDQRADSLRLALADAGINAVPVCDLIQIADPEWQPAIESYLGSNIDALLVEGDSTTEEAAFRVTRNQKGLFGTKVVLASQQRAPKTPGADWVATMVAGQHQAARWFIQGLLGELVQADGEADALGKPRALTRDFMLKTHGVFERLRPLAAHQLRIGYADVAAEKCRLETDRDALKDEKRRAEAQQKELTVLLGLIATIATTTTLPDDVATARSEVVLANAAVATLKADLARMSNAEEETLQADVKAAFDLLEQHRSKETTLISTIGGLVRDVDHAEGATKAATMQATACRAAAKALTERGDSHPNGQQHNGIGCLSFMRPILRPCAPTATSEVMISRSRVIRRRIRLTMRFTHSLPNMAKMSRPTRWTGTPNGHG
ncbi:ATP-binding protein [Jeongeupia sp. USM3]|uniref:ATP-binding protein n=1 Tax=Jeongeupia sp. USM3 TaxID=1906741 RepID=UPI0009F347A9|nr:ATP-binding protein [Jeongeupia sp. USM3]